MKTAKQAVREQDINHRETVASALEDAGQWRLAERYRGNMDATTARKEMERLVKNGVDDRVPAARKALDAIDAHIAWTRKIVGAKPAAPSKGYFFVPEPDYFAFQDQINPR